MRRGNHHSFTRNPELHRLRRCGISPRYGGLLSRRLPGEDPPDRLEPDAFLERVEDDADLTRVRRQAEREATGRSVAKGATRVGPDRKSKRRHPRDARRGLKGFNASFQFARFQFGELCPIRNECSVRL